MMWQFSKKTHGISRPGHVRSGFTLIEFLVAFGLFAIIVSVAVGGFVRALRIQRQLVALAAANSNVSLALEQMAREIRVGKGFACGNSVCDELSFKTPAGRTIVYRLDGTTKTIQRSCASCIESTGFESITGENVRIHYLEFHLQGTAPADFVAGRVTISLGVSPKESGIDTNVVRVQTTVSARNPD